MVDNLGFETVEAGVEAAMAAKADIVVILSLIHISEKSTTRDTGLNCEAQASYQPSWGGIDLSTSWNYQYSLNSLNDNDTYTRYYNFGLDVYKRQVCK